MKQLCYASIACAMFFASAALLNRFALWSRPANLSIPWLLSAIGMSVGLLGIHAWYEQRAFPKIWHVLLFLAITMIAFLAVAVDTNSYGKFVVSKGFPDRMEIIGFALIYAFVLFPAFICRTPSKH